MTAPTSTRFAILLIALFCTSASAAQPLPPAKLAAPGLNGLNLTTQEIEFFSEHFATQFAFEGVKVTTAAQIGAVIGLEREKQLLGCQDGSSSCMTELANALGVDGIITGAIAKIEDVYQLNLKIVAADDASNLSTYSSQVKGQKALLSELNKAAKVMTRLMNEKRAKHRAAALAARGTAGPGASEASGAQDAGPSGSAVSSAAQTGADAASAGATPVSSSDSTSARKAEPGNAPQVVQVEDPPAPSADSRLRTSRITVGPTLIIAGILPFEYERALGENLSLALGLRASFPAILLLANTAGLGVGGSAELRYFPLKAAAPEGLWLGPQIDTGYYVQVGELAGEQLSTSLNALLGYTYISDGGFTASAGLGVGAGYSFINTVGQGRPGLFPNPVLHLNVGYAF